MKDIIYRSQSLMKSIRMNAKISRTRHLIVKLQNNKDKEKAIKAARRISYKGMTINLQQQWELEDIGITFPCTERTQLSNKNQILSE